MHGFRHITAKRLSLNEKRVWAAVRKFILKIESKHTYHEHIFLCTKYIYKTFFRSVFWLSYFVSILWKSLGINRLIKRHSFN